MQQEKPKETRFVLFSSTGNNQKKKKGGGEKGDFLFSFAVRKIIIQRYVAILGRADNGRDATCDAEFQLRPEGRHILEVIQQKDCVRVGKIA